MQEEVAWDCPALHFQYSIRGSTIIGGSYNMSPKLFVAFIILTPYKPAY